MENKNNSEREYFIIGVDKTKTIKNKDTEEDLEIYDVLEKLVIYDEKYTKKKNAYIKVLNYAEKQD